MLGRLIKIIESVELLSVAIDWHFSQSINRNSFMVKEILKDTSIKCPTKTNPYKTDSEFHNDASTSLH